MTADNSARIRVGRVRTIGVMTAEPPIYSRCPTCERVTPASAVVYTPTGDHDIDWSEEVYAVCAVCRGDHLVIRADVLVLDAMFRCGYCGQTSGCPRTANAALCLHCGGISG
jgi:hypothetical protein